jgi:hypothetical protein
LLKKKKGHPQKIPHFLKKAIPFPKKAAILSAVFRFFPSGRRFSRKKTFRTPFFPFFSGFRLIFPVFMV